MKEYISVDTKQMRKSTRIAAIAAGLFFIGLGIIRPSIYAGLIGAVIIAAMLLSKETVVCEEGIVVRYDAILYQYGLQTVRTAFYEGYHDQKTCLSDSGGERGSGVCERNES